MAEVSVPTLGAVKEFIHSIFILFLLLYLPSSEYLSRAPPPPGSYRAAPLWLWLLEGGGECSSWTGLLLHAGVIFGN